MNKLQMFRYITVITMLFLGSLCAQGQQYDRGYETVPSYPFVTKGTWIAGGTARYSQHVNDNYNFLVINDINSKGYSVAANPQLFYAIKDNVAVGVKFSYNRGMLDLASADMSFGEISMSANDCYQINHKYSARGVFRAYIPLAGSKRIAMFTDLMLGGSLKQGKAYNGGGDYLTGTYQKNYALELAVDPGIVAFLSERLALELNLGIFGVSYSWANQIHNQVYRGHSDSASAGFTINLLSLGVGMSYYFLR